jgi:hypothetical protein
MFAMTEGLERFVQVELAKAAAEGDVLLNRDVLAADEQDAVRIPQSADFGDGGVRLRGAQIQAQQFDTEGVREPARLQQRCDVASHVFRFLLLPHCSQKPRREFSPALLLKP